MNRDLARLGQKKILVTCSERGAGDLLERLGAIGAVALHIPLIEICDPGDRFAALDAAIGRLASYAWVAFTSKNGVDAFFSRPGACPLPASVRLAAIGPGTAAAIARRGAGAEVVAGRHDAEGLAAAMGSRVQEGDRVLWPRARDARAALAVGLHRRGAAVEEVEAYQTVMPANVDRERLVQIVEEKAVDAVLFDSPSAVRHFVEIVGGERARLFAQKAELIPIGPITAAAIEQQLRC